MLHIVTVNWNNYCGQGSAYANRLFDMVRRNLPEGFPGKFTCFTDDPTGLDPGIEPRELPGNLEGWWNKLYLFKEGLFPEGDRIIFMDLDTLIVGPLDDIAAYDGDFAILKDFYRHGGLQSSIMAWEAGKGTHIWENYKKANYPKMAGGDQIWIEDNIVKHRRLQDIFPGAFVSYKVHCRNGPPKGAKVVVFHGHPRPHEVQDDWVKAVWKIGGGTSFELVLACNTEAARIEENIRSALTLGLPEVKWKEPHAGHAVITCGGPSLADDLAEIFWRKEQGQTIFAANGAHEYLSGNGIKADYHVMVDARPENAAFVPDMGNCYYASQCHPDTFQAAALAVCDVKLWHPFIPGIQEILGDRNYALIGGGSSVGLKMIALAYTLGYREFHLYGMDSSYRDTHHAYPQPLNDGERVITVEAAGETFRCAPWMVTQVNEFENMAAQLVAAGCVFTVHGDGLLPCIARRMQRPETAENTILIDGEMWPAADVHCRPSVYGTLPDIDRILAAVGGRRVAVQAGGNCGIWPERLARHFDVVYTFEPDPLNFRCLAHNAGSPNVVKFQAALGDANRMIGLDRNAANVGAHSVAGEGIIPVLRLDDFGLPACDLLQLDVEGYEFSALKGAEGVILRHRPVIVVEQKGLGEKYGWPDDMLAEYLASLGYREAARIHRDIIYTFNN